MLAEKQQKNQSLWPDFFANKRGDFEFATKILPFADAAERPI